MTAAVGIELRPLPKAAGPAEQVIDDYIRSGAVAWGEDLAAAVAPLRGALRQGRLDGWVACQDAQGLGLVVCLERAATGRISFVHLLSDYPQEDLVARLVGHVVVRLREAGCRHIASHASPAAHLEAIRQAFLGLGFTALERMIMSVALDGDLPGCPLPPAYELSAWEDHYLERVAQLFYDANRDAVDARIYPQFRTLDETLRMVEAIRDGGAGPFVEEASGIVLHGRMLCGAIMLVCPEPGQGFVVIVAIAPAYQGRGVGRALLARTLAAARKAGIQTVELTVTEGNLAAVSLYRRLGFSDRRRMTAYVWEAT